MMAMVVREFHVKSNGQRKKHARSAGKWVADIILATLFAVLAFSAYVYYNVNLFLCFIAATIFTLMGPKLIDLITDDGALYIKAWLDKKTGSSKDE